MLQGQFQGICAGWAEVLGNGLFRPSAAENKMSMAEIKTRILSEHPASGSFQVIHPASARGFDEGQGAEWKLVGCRTFAVVGRRSRRSTLRYRASLPDQTSMNQPNRMQTAKCR
jgi:hypothetical protein